MPAKRTSRQAAPGRRGSARHPARRPMLRRRRCLSSPRLASRATTLNGRSRALGSPGTRRAARSAGTATARRGDLRARVVERERLGGISVLYARLMAAMSSPLNPRRRRPSLLVAARLGRVARDGHVWRHVLQHDRSGGEHRVRADAAELMHADEAAEHRIVVDDHVPGELGVVGERRRRCRSRSRARRASTRAASCRRRSS